MRDDSAGIRALAETRESLTTNLERTHRPRLKRAALVVAAAEEALRAVRDVEDWIVGYGEDDDEDALTRCLVDTAGAYREAARA